MKWINVKDVDLMEEEGVIGIQMPHRAWFACHYSGGRFWSDETDDVVEITHYHHRLAPPK